MLTRNKPKTQKERSRKHYLKHKDELKAYRQEHKGEKKKYLKQYSLEHRKERREYELENKEKLLRKRQEYRQANKERINEYQRKYNLENREKVNENQRKYVNRRRKEDVNFRLAHDLRSRLRDVIRGGNSGSAVRDLGCSIPELKIYLQNQFKEGMDWGNWTNNGWHIDHIVPVSLFDLTDRNQFLQAAHYTNLQPMWAIDNLKKSNKLS